jgi:hypothetical protein
VENVEEQREKGVEAPPSEFCGEMHLMRHREPTAPVSRLLDDHYEQRVRNLEELLEQERQGARNYIDQVKECNTQELD